MYRYVELYVHMHVTIASCVFICVCMVIDVVYVHIYVYTYICVNNIYVVLDLRTSFLYKTTVVTYRLTLMRITIAVKMTI